MFMWPKNVIVDASENILCYPKILIWGGGVIKTSKPYRVIYLFQVMIKGGIIFFVIAGRGYYFV